jgi:hypothetical protein
MSMDPPSRSMTIDDCEGGAGIVCYSLMSWLRHGSLGWSIFLNAGSLKG